MTDIVPASDWSRETWGTLSRMDLPARRLWVHHGAAGTPTLDTLRGYDRYHVRTRGWRALGYSYAITGDGTVYEGRGVHVGAHTGGDNRWSLGVCLVGDWTDGRPPMPMVASLADLVTYLAGRRLLAEAAIAGGHRDAPNASTTCPGAGGMWAIGEARRLIANQPATSTEETTVGWKDTARRWAMGRGYSNGDRPDDPVTRVEMWATLKNFEEGGEVPSWAKAAADGDVEAGVYQARTATRLLRGFDWSVLRGR